MVFLMSIEKITNSLLCGRIPEEWIHALYLAAELPLAAGFRETQGGDWSEQWHTKKCSLADDASDDSEPMPPELLTKTESQVWLDAKWLKLCVPLMCIVPGFWNTQGVCDAV